MEGVNVLKYNDTGYAQCYKYGDNKICVFPRNGEPWFILKDVCDALGISNTTKAAKRFGCDDLAIITVCPEGQMYLISKFGLYDVLLSSNKPEVRSFKRWCSHNVLPDFVVGNGQYKI